jgi:hypothetical protein
MPELNVLCGIADYSTQSGQPITKNLVVEITPSQNGRMPASQTARTGKPRPPAPEAP